MDKPNYAERNAALLNGALIALGGLAIVDNVVAHWLLDLHRAIPGPNAGVVEVSLVIVGAILLLAGVGREWRVRRHPAIPRPRFEDNPHRENRGQAG